MNNNIRYYGSNEKYIESIFDNSDPILEINSEQIDNAYCGITKSDMFKYFHTTQSKTLKDKLSKDNLSKDKLGCCIYVISTTKLAKKNNYKIGRHSGSISKLQTRYRTYLINPEIYYLVYVDHYELIESEIKNLVKKYVIKDSKGKKTEWVNIKLSKLKSIIDGLVLNYNEKVSS
ncbi:Bacteriophage T5 Orf172 DNA-binding domain-containing protein [Megavirus chiliensis]|uniref:Bacteriophage T5 Orf172 DNA-binding domain-containing protein n=2 Tax=Megamimivirinae TaxID=3044648 RepID=A0A2L2DL02_MIMIV|nr:hypothetical protein MegaChil _gp0016 [Megavirus chiliensis]AEQ33247.1 Bacteriophage T5 Orf172 DNA-binding domain-containing protein [Megavirus chiliensis]AVG46862.1 hypothetical protein [Acanthamoeba polyphaga mimivirus]